MKIRSKDFFKLPNDIFEKNLSATEIRVLAAIYSLKSRSICFGVKHIKIKQSVIAKICGLSSSRTVSQAINKLCLYGYIKEIRRYYSDTKKLGTFVYIIPVIKANYFFVSRRIFNYNLTSSQLRMYLFFCKAAVSSSRRSWNSYNDIANALNLRRSSVIQTVQELVQMRLIKKYRIRKKDGSFSDNHYEVVALKFEYKFRQKKKRHHFRPSAFPLIKIYIGFSLPYSCSLRQKMLFVKRLRKICKNIFSRGSPKRCSSVYSTHFKPYRRKNRIKLYLKYRC